MPVLDIDDNNNEGESRPADIPRRLYRTTDELGTSTLFSKDHKLDNIVQYIKGMKWTVDYFLQLRNVNDELTPLDINSPATVQKYNRISKLIIILQSGIEQNNIDSIEGEAVINAGFLPNKYDCFLATLTGGRQAIFTLTNVELRKYSLHDTYWVNFKLLTFVDIDNSKLYNNLIYKTVKEYIYDKEHLLDYSAPVILRADYNNKLNLKNKYKEVLDYYLDNFIDNKKKIISPPTKSSTYTDLLLSEFIYSIINQEDSNRVIEIVRLNPDKSKNIRFTIWDAIINRDLNMLKRCTTNIGFKYNVYDRNSINSRQYNFLGITFIADELGNTKPVIPEYIDLSTYSKYFTDEVEEPKEEKPIEVEDSILNSKYITIGMDNTLKDSNSIHNSNAPAPSFPIKKEEKVEIELPKEEVKEELPVDKPVEKEEVYKKPIKHPDDNYVLSDNFYKQNLKELGIVEESLLEYLRGEIINKDNLAIMLDQYHMWSTKDQFYLIPILIVLIKDSIINTFKSI